MSRVKGSTLSEEHKNKISIALMGHLVSDDTRRKFSLLKSGTHVSEAQKEKIRLKMTGRVHTWGYKISEAQNKRWEGIECITPLSNRIRKSEKYIKWRKAVYERDGYKCILCGISGGWNKDLKRNIKLNADHIKPFSLFPELRFELSNGRTLCEECHWKTDTFGHKAKRYKERIK